MPTNKSKTIRTLKNNRSWNNFDSQKSYNRITSNKKHRVIMRHCSSCGWRLRYKYSLNSNMNIKKKSIKYGVKNKKK